VVVQAAAVIASSITIASLDMWDLRLEVRTWRL